MQTGRLVFYKEERGGGVLIWTLSAQIKVIIGKGRRISRFAYCRTVFYSHCHIQGELEHVI